MARKVEEVGDWVVNGDEALEVPGRFEPLHDPLSSPRWLMRILGAIVEPLVLTMFEFHPHFRARSAVGAELIGDHYPGCASLFADELAQEPFGCLLVTTALNQGVKDETILINGTPKPMLCAIDGHDDFIDMPFVAELRCAPPDAIGEFSTEFLRPAPDRFVADDNSTDSEQVLDHSQAKRKPKIQPDGMDDDLGWKAMTTIEAILNLAHAA
jgi:hypothetical protein